MERPWLYVGAKVVCVRNDFHGATARLPVVGETYTVRAIESGMDDYNKGDVYLHLDEIRNAPVRYSGRLIEPSFNVLGFRPVLPDTTKAVDEMRRMMRDHVANASGGAGIKRGVRV